MLTTLRLTLGLALPAVAAAAVWVTAAQPGLPVPATLALALGAVVGTALITGVLLALQLQHGLMVAGAALERLRQGRPVGTIQPLRSWPLNELLEQITELSSSESRLGAVREQLLRQAGAAAAQEERNRLARELHDSIKQQIFAISVGAATAQARWEEDPDGARAAIAEVRRSTQEAMTEMRAMLQQLRPAPLETVGLVEALREQGEALGYRTGARVDTEFGQLPGDERLPAGTQESLFRIAQEAFANIARHARASAVLVRLHACAPEDTVVLIVQDDGQGFDPRLPAAGAGLTNMTERAQALGGTLEVRSAPGVGTTVRATVPPEDPAAAPAGGPPGRGVRVLPAVAMLVVVTLLVLVTTTMVLAVSGLWWGAVLAAMLLSGVLAWRRRVAGGRRER